MIPKTHVLICNWNWKFQKMGLLCCFTIRCGYEPPI
uniref:Uncharacterized protein n=1 Tax=Rhizophora mucronata TaxID=61149 RepID=A0A2P2PLE5_RHIMU